MSVQLFSQGILAQVWLFAHCPQRLSRMQVLSFPISESVSLLKSCKTVIALRISAQLLIGVMRLFAGQVKLLIEEMEEAMEQMGRTVEPVLVQESIETPFKRRKTMEIAAIKRTEMSTFLQPAQEMPAELVACSEEITINDREFKGNPLPNPGKRDHISTSNTFLEDLIDEEFLIDPLLPKVPAALPAPEPEPTPALVETEQEAPVMDLDWSVREDPTPVKKKRTNRREKEEKKVNIVEEDEVVLPAESIEQEETHILTFSQAQSPPVSLPEPVPDPPPPPTLPPQPIPSTPVLEAPPKRGFRKLKKGWSSDTGNLLLDYEAIADINSTGDIVRIPSFEQEHPAKSQASLEKLMIYEPLVEGMTRELGDWFTSNHKMLLVKNAFREAEEAEIPAIPHVPTKRERPPPVPAPVPVVSHDSEPIIPILKLESLDESSPNPEQLSERSIKMLQLIGYRLKGRSRLLFSELAAGKCARTRACGFFELLVLTKRRLLAIDQGEGLGEIEIRLEQRD